MPNEPTRIAQPDAAYDTDADFLFSVMSASGDCIKVLDLDANLIYMSKGGQAVMEVSDFNAIRGCPWPDFWQDQGHVDARQAIATALAGGVGSFRGAATTMKGNPRYWDVQVTPILGADGKPERLLSVSRDITAAHLVEIELRQTRARLELALRAGQLGYWDFDLGTGVLEASDICKQIFGRDPSEPFTYADLEQAVHPADREYRAAAVAQAARSGDDLNVEYRIIRPDGSQAWVLIQARAVRSETGAIEGLAGISLDISAHKREEDQRQLLGLELNHRIKNQLAVVQSIVNQALRGNHPLELARRLISERLSTLAEAHDLVLGGEGQRASVSAIVAAATRLLDAERLEIAGPDLNVGPRAALSLALIVHELSTNAIKYGALSDRSGRVRISWEMSVVDGVECIVLDFVESGGPLVHQPTTTGFGSRLLRAGIGGLVSQTTLDYAPAGLRYRLVVDVKSAQLDR
jgi:PAS domain S-box-containing protein